MTDKDRLAETEAAKKPDADEEAEAERVDENAEAEPAKDAEVNDTHDEAEASETPALDASVNATPESEPQEVSKVVRLERLTRESFPGVEELELFDMPDGYIAAVRVGDKVDEEARLALGKQLVDLFAGQGVLVEPLLYRADAWKQLGELAGESWYTLLSAEGRARKLHELYRTKRPYPRDFRRLMLGSARSYLTFIELILREAPFPLHLLAALTAEVMRDALELLFASRGQHFDGSAETLATFEAEFVASGAFSVDQLALYFQLRGLARQTRLFHDVGAEPPDGRFDWEPLAERVRGFFGDFERYAHARFSTAAERRRRRVLRIAIPSAIALILLVVVTWTYSTLKPLEPVTATVGAKLRRRQGGIMGTYFKGARFQKKVRERLDPMINIHTTGTPEPKAGADDFSVRWKGYLRFLKDDRHAVCLESDDGGRLWLGDELIVDDWGKHKLRKKCKMVRVKRGWYPLKIEYYDMKGLAVARLKVGLEERRAKVVRSVDLCCRPEAKRKKPGKLRQGKAAVLRPTVMKKTPVKKAPVKKAPVKKAPVKKAPAAKKAPAKG